MARKQKIGKKMEIEFNNVYDDEIDLFELFQKIWKWKWLTITIIFIFCLATFSYIKSTPLTYTVESSIRIGKIANVLIEELQSINTYLESEVYNKSDICLTSSTLKIDTKTSNIKISSTANSPEIAYSCFNMAANNLLSRHKIIYNKALKKLNENIASIKTKMIIEPTYLLDTYTFPSSLITKPEIPIKPDNKKLSLKIAVAFFSSLFLGIFLSFFIDYILSRRAKG
jgi:hypothetical protein